MDYSKDGVDKLIDSYLHEIKIKKITKNDLKEFFTLIGFREDVSESISNFTYSWWSGFSKPPDFIDFKTAVHFGLKSLPSIIPDILLQQAPDQPIRNPVPLPEQLDPVETEHGTVRRGRRGENGPSTDLRPYIYLWFERNPDDDCKIYQWFQFVHPSIWIGPVGGPLRNWTGRLNDDEKIIKASTGVKTTFCQWNPDYQKDEIEKEEKATGKKQSTFHPPGDEFDDNDKAKPYRDRIIPGTHGRVGLVDAPNWTSRPRTSRGKLRPSPLEHMWRRAGSRHIQRSKNKPPASSEVVEIRMEFRSYLVCVDNGECLGYISWESVSRAQVDFDWKLKGSIGMGIGEKDWEPVTEMSNIEFTLTIGDWTPCD